jgi:hypothetical protein
MGRILSLMEVGGDWSSASASVFASGSTVATVGFSLEGGREVVGVGLVFSPVGAAVGSMTAAVVVSGFSGSVTASTALGASMGSVELMVTSYGVWRPWR